VCAREHAACKVPTTPFIPTRLIDVGDALSPDPPRLISTHQKPWATAHCTGSEFRGQPLRDPVTQYLAYSYCWGSLETPVTHFRTTKENVHQRRCGISLDALPQSFRDLSTAARELGLRFVWIDSLCIVQDDPEDLAREIGKMGEVYGQAYLTLAWASGASPCDSLLMRNRYQPIFKVPFATSMGRSVTGSYSLLSALPELGGDFATDVQRSKYNQRGWTFQERFLSRRVLYFCNTMLRYECQELECSEEFVATDKKSWGARWCPIQDLQSSGSKSVYATWYTLIFAYSQRQ